MNYQAIGCGNTGNEWCNGGADDTLPSTITLSSSSTQEIVSNTTAVPYENRWHTYSFTESISNDFLTQDTSVDLNIAGNDTGNSNNWWGPIIDNISLTFTLEEYIEPIPEPIVQAVPEPIVEPIVELIPESTVIEGLDLDTEIITDVILDTPIDMAQVELPEINLPEVDIDLEIEVEPEIEMNEEQIEVVEEEIEIVDEEIDVVEEPEELKVDSGEDDIKAEKKEKTEKKEKVAKKTPSNSQNKPRKNISGTKSTPKIKVKSKANAMQQLDIASMVYLQMIPETIKLQENISLIQESVYEQDISFITSDTSIDFVIGNSGSRWDSVVGQRHKHQATSYRTSN